MTNNSYDSIRAWGRIMGSNRSYVEAQILKAQRTNAPADAIYERDGVWSTVREVTGLPALRELESLGIDVSAARQAMAEAAIAPHRECVYRALAAMATNYADTIREIRLGQTDVTIDQMTLPTVENADEWSHEFGICTCEPK